ncbi:MAG: hypothetical protein AAGA91_05865 [Pseudomonadota bacterium]
MIGKVSAGVRHLEPLRQLLFNRRDLFLQHNFRSRRQHFYETYWREVCSVGGWECEQVGSACFRVRAGDRVTYALGYYVQLDSPAILSIAEDKVLSRKLLMEIGAPVPKQLSYSVTDYAAAVEFMHKLEGAVVVKPAFGGGGKGVVTDIKDKATLIRATAKASAINASVIVEEQVSGDNYRLLYLRGELIDCVRRDFPTVVGNGRDRINKLLETENQQRLEAEQFTALSPILMDASIKNFFRSRGMKPDMVPAEGSHVEVKAVVNQNSARDNHRVTQSVNKYYENLGHDIYKLTDISLLGIDVITPDISQPATVCGGAINEINGTPAFHHHELVAQQDRLSHVGPQVMASILESAPVVIRKAG